MNHYVVDGQYAMGISMASFQKRAQAGQPSPTPRLEPGGQVRRLMQGQSGSIVFGPLQDQLVAFGILTCAAVILCSYSSQAQAAAAVYHAPSGTLSQPILATLSALVGNPQPASLLAAYVVPKPWDPNYDRDCQELVTFGIPTAQVAYLDNLPSVQFGINSLGQVGM
jgi:hypothetical protein